MSLELPDRGRLLRNAADAALQPAGMNGIHYVSNCDHSGYATAARRALRGLRAAGTPFTWTRMVPGRAWGLGYVPLGHALRDGEFDACCGPESPHGTLVAHLVPEYALRWREREPHKRLVLYTTWETDRIPCHWRFFLELADLVLVPSTWNKDVFDSAGLRVPVRVLPHIAPPAPLPCGPGPVQVRQGDFVFLTINAWSTRKRLRSLIRCYLDAFTAADPVHLVIKTDSRCHDTPQSWLRRPSAAQTVKALQRERRNPARITLLTRRVSEQEIMRLHAQADCYLSLTHGEGWGIGSFDAAAYGTPVIATNFGGALDYLTPRDSYLVNSRLIPVRDELGRPSFMSDQNWAEPDPLHTVELMRHVVANRDQAVEKAGRLQQSIREKFNETTVTGRLLDILGDGRTTCPAKAST